MRPPRGVSAGLQGPSTRGGKGPAYHQIVTPSLWGEGPALMFLPRVLLLRYSGLEILLPLSHPSLFLPKDKQADRVAGGQLHASSTWKVSPPSLLHKGPYPCGEVPLRPLGELFPPHIFTKVVARVVRFLCARRASSSLPTSSQRCLPAWCGSFAPAGRAVPSPNFHEGPYPRGDVPSRPRGPRFTLRHPSGESL